MPQEIIRIWSVHLSRGYILGTCGRLDYSSCHIVEYKGENGIRFHHDCVPSGGTTRLRSLRCANWSTMVKGIFYKE